MLHVSLKKKMSHFWAREHNMLNGLISDNTKFVGAFKWPTNRYNENVAENNVCFNTVSRDATNEIRTRQKPCPCPSFRVYWLLMHYKNAPF